MPFTASIIQRQFIDIPDNILSLSGASYLRKLPVLTMPWSRIRIGLICAVSPNGVANIADCNFLLGICSGQVYPGSSFNTANFLGASLIGTQAVGATRLLTYNAAGPYYGATVGYFFSKADGNIVSNSATFATAVNLALAFTGRYDRRTLLVLDITLAQGGSGATTMTLYGPSTTLVQTTDYRPDDLQYAIDNITTPTIRGQAMTALSSLSTVVASPLTGDLDTLEVHWGNTTFPLEISAIGANVILEPYYGDSGIAIDSFESYAASNTGSIDAQTFLSSGSGWSSNGSIGYDTSTAQGINANTSNLAAQVFGALVGTTTMPDDPIEQYALGTIASGVTINAGTYWPSTATVTAQANLSGPQSYGQYVGTTSVPDDPFEQYLTGTVNSGVTINAGSFWGGPATISGISFLYGPQSYNGYTGTTSDPAESFDAYVVNNGSTTGGTTSIFQYGSYWGNNWGTVWSGGSFNQTSFGTTSNNAAPAINIIYGTTAGNAYYGTTIGLPLDTFEQYSVGTVGGGIDINLGTGWSTNGSAYSYSI